MLTKIQMVFKKLNVMTLELHDLPSVLVDDDLRLLQ